MKKNYVIPEMEVVEITEQCNLLADSQAGGGNGGGGWNDGRPTGSRSFDDED